LSTATQKPALAQDTPVRPPPLVSTVNGCQPAGVSAYATPLLSLAIQKVGVGQDSPVKVPAPVSTRPGLLQTPFLRPSAWPAWSSATHLVAVAQEIATSPAEESAAALRQPAGGLDDSTAPPLSAA
jgi:hypothetical protein